MNDKRKKNGGKGTRVGNFLRGLKKTVLPSVLDAVGVGDLAKAIGLINDSPNNAGLSKEDLEKFFKLAEMDMQDRADARSLQKAALQQNDIFSKRYIYYLATGVFIFSAIIVLLLFFVEIPKENKDVVNFILGVVVGTGLTGIFQYFFGSSKGSKDKSDILASIQK